MKRNEFEGYIPPIYVDDEDDTLRQSWDGQSTRLRVVRDENGHLVYSQVRGGGELFTVEEIPPPRLTWWQWVKRWMGW